jgi:acyl carrier protein phosphodiesterase
MNYLAHLFLAEPTPDSLLGNLLADFVKRPALAALSPGIQAGVRMHRQVDFFTDCHPLVQRSIGRISARWGWFSGILIDVYYDHLLAVNWARYSGEPLRHFVGCTYRELSAGIKSVPDEMERHVSQLIESDRLYSYRSRAGIAEALRCLSLRIRQRIPQCDVRVELALPDLIDLHATIASDFEVFFPQLIARAGQWRLDGRAQLDNYHAPR